MLLDLSSGLPGAGCEADRTRTCTCDEGRNIGMVRCYDCAKLEAYFIDSWDIFVYRCNKFRTLRMRIDTNIGKCPYFEAKKKK